MTRYAHKTKFNINKRLVIAICIFIAIILLFYGATNSVGENNESRELEYLENAITKSVAYCYAVEGFYPDDLNYIKENYGLIYNEDKYYVDYRAKGSNILPDITIVEVNQ